MLRTGVLYEGDNLAVLRGLPAESVDLVYLDPPFASGRDYGSFDDRWCWGEEAERAREESPLAPLLAAFGETDVAAYLAAMAPRLLELHRLLRPSGSLYLHCDPTASHYLKVVLDRVFGGGNFRREIVWRSGWVSGFKAAARNWVRNHDVLLYYAKDAPAVWFDKERAYTPHSPGYRRRGGGRNERGVAVDDVWTEVELMSPWIKSFSREKLGYRTQKPLALLRRVVEASCPPGGVVLDPFCGTGTTLAAAQQLGRRWIGIDASGEAIAVSARRLREELGVEPEVAAAA